MNELLFSIKEKTLQTNKLDRLKQQLILEKFIDCKVVLESKFGPYFWELSITKLGLEYLQNNPYSKVLIEEL